MVTISTDKGNDFSQNRCLICGTRKVDLRNPLVMGILNYTPDSFYDGGSSFSLHKALQKAETMMQEGATFIDIGGVSTRPGSDAPSVSEEINRIIPVLKSVMKEFPEAIVSIDTFRAEVARAALAEGVHMINDISGGMADDEMLSLMAESEAAYIMMHMQGTPQTMQNNPYYDDVTADVASFFATQLLDLQYRGKQNIILDPGFGFGKTLQHNYTLLNNLSLFKDRFGLPVLVGISRKSMIYKPFNISATEALNGSTVVNTLALLKGADILRVHDVKPAVQAIKLVSIAQQSL